MAYNIPRELFNDLTEIVNNQNCSLIRKICADNDWDANQMIRDLLDKKNTVPDEHFNTPRGVITRPITEKEMEKKFKTSSDNVIKNNLLIENMKSPESFIKIDEKIIVCDKEYDIYRMNNDISGLLILWKGKYCIWDIENENIYSINNGNITLLEECKLQHEDMVKYAIEY